MSDGPSPLFDPPHTIEETETTSIATCWKLNEKNEESRDKNEQYTRTVDDDDMVEHLEILDKETKRVTEWTTLGTGKNAWAWAGAIKNERGEILGHSSSKNDALAIAMANGSWCCSVVLYYMYIALFFRYWDFYILYCII